MNLARQHHVRVDPSFTQLVSGIALLEGIGRQLDPDLDLFRIALPILLEAHPEYKKKAIQIATTVAKEALFT